MAKELLAPATGAGQTPIFEARARDLPLHFFCSPNLAATETGTLQISPDDGTSWQDYYVDGTLQQITDTNTGLTIIAPGDYRINKGVTAGAVGVYCAYLGNN